MSIIEIMFHIFTPRTSNPYKCTIYEANTVRKIRIGHLFSVREVFPKVAVTLYREKLDKVFIGIPKYLKALPEYLR